MAQTSSFFELAALLLPVLMLSGYATARLRPPGVLDVMRSESGWRWPLASVAVVVAFGFFPVTAEVMALSAVMAGEPLRGIDTWIVAFAVAFGTYTVAIAWSWPWIRLPWVHLGWRGRVVLAVSSTLLVAMSGGLLGKGVELQQARSKLDQSRGTPADSTENRSGDAFYLLVGDHIDMTLRRLDAERREGVVSRREYLDQYAEYERLWTQLVVGELKARQDARSQALDEALNSIP